MLAEFDSTLSRMESVTYLTAKVHRELTEVLEYLGQMGPLAKTDRRALMDKVVQLDHKVLQVKSVLREKLVRPVPKEYPVPLDLKARRARQANLDSPSTA